MKFIMPVYKRPNFQSEKFAACPDAFLCPVIKAGVAPANFLSLIHISEPTRPY